MGATDTASHASSNVAATGGLIEQVNFQRIFSGLSQNGIVLSTEDQVWLEEKIREETRRQNGGQLAGTNIGGTAVNLIQVLFSFIQNLFGGNGTAEFSFAGFTNQLSSALSGATNSGQQHVINTINANVHDAMIARGGTVALAAPLLTGLTTGSGPAPDMQDSLMNQFIIAQNNQGVTSTLNRPAASNTELAAANINIGNGLPAAMRPLTSPVLGG